MAQRTLKYRIAFTWTAITDEASRSAHQEQIEVIKKAIEGANGKDVLVTFIGEVVNA